MRELKVLSKYFLLLAILVVFSASISASNTVIEGTVIDFKTKEPISFCSVYLKSTLFGTVTNDRGAFRIVVNRINQNDSLVISYLGYETQKLLLSNVKQPINIYLKGSQVELDEVVISNISAETILTNAIAKVPENHFYEPYKVNGFYRVTSKKDTSYVHLSEAVFGLYQSKVDKVSKQFKLVKARAIKDEKASNGIDLGMKPNGVFNYDIVNYIDKTDLLSSKGIKLHDFTLGDYEIVNNRIAYKIEFDQKGVKKSGYKGYILIDRETLAFLYFDFGLSPKGIAYKRYGDFATRALMKVLGLNISMLKDNHKINYKKIGDKYYLDNVRNDVTLDFKTSKGKRDLKVDIEMDYLITSIETSNVTHYEGYEILGKDKFIESQRDNNYNEAFWDDYTIILPSVSFEEIAKGIVANNEMETE